jgi:O-antigen ligase
MVNQLSPSQFGNVRSSQDRTSDYDGVRPDVVSHLLFGRGYQSYDGHKYRILDNEYLFLIIGVGLIGLVAYLAILAAALSAAHGTARSRDPVRARFVLGAAGAVAVIGMATALFDVLSFPHVPYLLFFMAAIIVVLREPARHDLAIGPPGPGALAEPRPPSPPSVTTRTWDALEV